MATRGEQPYKALSSLGAIEAVAKLELARVIRGKALRAAAIVGGILVIAATISCFAGDSDSRATFVMTVRRLFPWFAMGLSLLFAARAVSDDVESGILHYYYILPVPRWSVTLGKYLCSVTVVASLLLAATVLLYIGTHLAEPSLFAAHHMDLWQAAGAVLSAALCYTAVFIFLGSAVSDLPYLLPLLFITIFEVGAGSLPVLELLSVRHHVNILLGVSTTATMEGTVDQVLQTLGLVTPQVPLWAALVIVGSVFAVFLGLTVLVTEYAEYRTGKP